jgi:Na+/H+-translocating membrane pyrophosphatase
MGRSDDETGSASSLRGAALPVVIAIALPTVVGLLFGPATLAGFLVAVISCGYFIVTGFNNSGRHFENTAIQSLSSVIKMMTVFSAAFLPVFIRIGGFLF